MGHTPWYNQDADYNTNAKSYMDYLARHNKFMKVLVEDYEVFKEIMNQEFINFKNDTTMTIDDFQHRLDGIKEEMKDFFVLWLEDGTLEQIINDEVLGNKADIEDVENFVSFLTAKDTELAEDITESFNTHSINVKHPPKGYTPAVGDGITDDTEALQSLLDAFDLIFFPDGEYLISDSLRLRQLTTLKGHKHKTLFTSQTPDITFFLGNRHVDDTTSFRHAHLSGIKIMGMGKTSGQTGISINGYQTTIEEVFISGCDTGLKMSGVTIDTNNSYFSGNRVGIEIPYYPTTAFSTMLRFRGCTIHSNDTGVEQLEGDRVVGLYFEHCAFELNTNRGVDVNPYSGGFSFCWFEKNGQSPRVKNYRLLLIHNRFESTAGYPSQSFVYTDGFPGAGQTRGHVELGLNHISTKRLEIQRHTSNGDDYTRLSIEATGDVDDQQLHLRDSVSNKIKPIVNTNSVNRQRLYGIRISPEGAVLYNDFEQAGITVTMLPNQTYIITFDAWLSHHMHVSVRNPHSQGNDLSDADTYYHTQAFRINDLSSYPSYNAVIVKVFKRDATTLDDTQTTGYIDLTLFGK